MSNEIIQLAQAEASVVENLEASDQKMIDLNNKLVGFLDEYEKLNFSQNGQSFFSFQNIYFWVLLIGLLLLALGLILFLAELKKNAKDKKEEKVASILAQEEEVEEAEETEEEEEEEQMKPIVLDKEEGETGEEEEVEDKEEMKLISLDREKIFPTGKTPLDYARGSKTKRKPIKIKVVKVK
ncbi:MAG: hypothetical protein Q8O32_01465 [bacterium]|nr:hypothetical protein [bacterium]